MSDLADRRAYRAANAVLAAALTLAALAPRLLAPTPDGEGVAWRGRRLPNLCLDRHLSGRPCDTCRLGRAVALASRGEWRAASAQHRAGPLVWSWVALQALARLALALAAPRPRRWRIDAGLSGASLIVVWAAARFWLR